MSNWIKVLNTLPRSRAVFSLMRGMRCKRHAAIGLAVDWFCWLDENSTGGETGMTDEEIDEVLGAKGAAKSLAEIGWIEHDETGFVVAVDFCKHNGISAKRRAETARRVTKCRAKGNAKSVNEVTSDALTRIDKNRIDNTELESSIYREGPKEEAGRERMRDAMAPRDTFSNSSSSPRPSGEGEVDSYLAGQPVLKLTPAERQKCAFAFYNELEAVGWIDKTGKNIWNWKAAALRYAAKWAENLHTPFSNGQKVERPSRNTGTLNDGRGSTYEL